MHGDELRSLGRSLDRDLFDLADPTYVVLVVERARLERRPLLRQQGAARPHVRHRDRGTQGENREVVFRMSPVVLLSPHLADLRPCRHVDAGLRVVAARLPTTFRARHATGSIELGSRLTEVPDVSVHILRVPIGRPLFEPPCKKEPVANAGATNALDRLRLAGDAEDVLRDLAVLDAAIDEGGTRNQWEPGVVDPANEIPRGRLEA